MRITCSCGESFDADDRAAEQCRCPACNMILPVPASSDAVSASVPRQSTPKPTQTSRARDKGRSREDTPSIRTGPSVNPLTLVVALLAVCIMLVVLATAILGAVLMLRDPNPPLAHIPPQEFVVVPWVPDHNIIKAKPLPLPERVGVAPNELRALTSVSAMRFSPDGRRLATVQHFGDGALLDVLQIWNCEDGKEIHKLYQGNDDVRMPTFSPDGTRCVCYHQGITVWDLGSGAKLSSVLRPPDTGFSDQLLSFSADGRFVFSTAEDRRVYRIDQADRSIHLLEKFVMERDTPRLACSPTAPVLVVGGADVRQIDPGDGAPGEPIHGGRVTAMAFSGDGKVLGFALTDSTLTLLDTATWKPRHTLRRERTDGFAYYFNIVLSKDGTTLVARPYFDGKALPGPCTFDVWDVPSQKRHQLAFDNHPVLALRPDGRILAVAQPDRPVYFVDPATGVKKDRFP